jgi:hypothetical protein
MTGIFILIEVCGEMFVERKGDVDVWTFGDVKAKSNVCFVKGKFTLQVCGNGNVEVKSSLVKALS